MMSETNGYTLASEFKARSRKDITLPSGAKVQIRKVKGIELVAEFGFLPEPNITTQEKINADPIKASQFMHKLICLAVVSPKVVLVNAGPDEILVEDLGGDGDALQAEIIAFSLGSKAVAELSFSPEGIPIAHTSDRESVPGAPA